MNKENKTEMYFNLNSIIVQLTLDGAKESTINQLREIRDTFVDGRKEFKRKKYRK